MFPRGPIRRSKPSPALDPDRGAGRGGGGGEKKLERFASGIDEAAEFGEAAEALLPILTDRAEYRALLLDVADNGEINDEANQEKTIRFAIALIESLPQERREELKKAI